MITFVRRSPFTGKMNSMNISVTDEQVERWECGELIQKAMPAISAEEREFIMTGITPDEWNSLFGGEE